MIKNLLWLLALNALAYCGVVVAMIWGWGLWPTSWLWVVTGYILAGMVWPFMVVVRTKIADSLKEAHEAAP